MKVGTVAYSTIVDDISRLDGKFHLSDGMKALKYISLSPYIVKPISEVTESVFMGGRSKRLYVENEAFGVEFWGITDVLNGNSKSGKYLSNKYAKLDRAYVEDGWTLIARSGSGAIGTAAYSNSNFEGIAISEHLIRVVPNSDEIRQGFLFAYLASSVGKSIVKKGIYGTAIPEIEPDYVKAIPIPIFPEVLQKEIHDLMTESAKLREGSDQLLNDAVNSFEEAVGKSKANLKYQVDHVKIDSIQNGLKRFDSQYQIIKKKIDSERFAELPAVDIQELANDIFVGGRGKRLYVKKGTPFLSSSEMMRFNPLQRAKNISSRTPSLEEMKVSKGEILVSRSGTVGNTVIVGDYLEGIAISEHALRIVVDSRQISPFYVFCYLKTSSGQMNLKCRSFGSVIITLNEELVGQIKIPILPNEHMGKIVKLVSDSQLRIDKARVLESAAIRLVEKEIESWQ